MSSQPQDDPRRQAQFDSQFADIVAHLEDDAPDEWPRDEGAMDNRSKDNGPEPPDADPVTNPTTSWWAAPPPDSSAGMPTQWRMPGPEESSLLDDDGEDFVPPTPAPLPKDDMHFWAILATLIGGPLWVLYLAFFDRYAQSLWWFLSIGTCVAGVVLLVLRQPKNRDEDEPDVDDVDDGLR